ncbi:MAG: metallophosphoesterase [Planctomycetota bacterium]|nr:metallophosphoesterase [Planctomycetota bacterium]
MTLVAHLSDLHVTEPRWSARGEITPKRVLGKLSWHLRRRHEHRPEVLELLARDLDRAAPDRVLITGDVTNQGLPAELREGGRWLDRLGGPQRVFLVPGNHDVYVPGSSVALAQAWARFPAPTADGCEPRVDVEGDLALVGVSSARATPPLFATGRVGRHARLRLERCLRRLAGGGLARVVLIHHPPWAGGISRRRVLEDAQPLRDLLARAGAGLVLHGHVHKTVFSETPGPDGPIPVVGVPSASALGRRGPERRARYHLLRRIRGGGFECRIRVLSADGTRFTDGGQCQLGGGDARSADR